jgi:hypothetical protein
MNNALYFGFSTLGETVDKCCEESPRKSWWVRPMFYVTIIWVTLKMASPYRLAKNYIAFQYYKGTEMYRQRLIELGPDFAKNSFTEYREDKLFIKKLTHKDKLSAFFTPWKHVDAHFREIF